MQLTNNYKLLDCNTIYNTILSRGPPWFHIFSRPDIPRVLVQCHCVWGSDSRAGVDAERPGLDIWYGAGSVRGWRTIYVFEFIYILNRIDMIYNFNPVGRPPVHEAKEAGKFMPGHGQYPVSKLSEDQLRLLRTRSMEDVLPSPAAETPRSLPQTEVEESPAPAAAGSKDTSGEKGGDGQVVETPVRSSTPGNEVDKTNKSPAPVVTPGHPNESGKPHGRDGKSAVRKNSSSYDKYKDGSYWKILGCKNGYVMFHWLGCLSQNQLEHARTK